MTLNDQVLPALEQAVALLTLCNGKRTAREAKAVLARTPRLRDSDPEARLALYDTLRRIYPLEGGLAGLRPDLLGETLVSQVLAVDDEVLDAAFGPDCSREDMRYALTVLTRLGRRVPVEQRWLRRALERNLTKIAEDALHVGMETGSPMPEMLAHVIKAAPLHERKQIVDALRNKLPVETLNLIGLSVEIGHQAVTFLQNKKSGKDTKRHADLTEAFLSLAIALKNRGCLAEAANAALEAKQHAERAFRSDKENDQKTLARVLANLGNCLSKVGRFDEALAAAEKAEEIQRGLAEKQPDAYTADWATSVGNLGNCLSKVGRFDEALAAAEKAEEIRRGLAEKQPYAYTANWATSLGNLGGHLRELGRFDEALAAAKKAEEIQRGLAEKQPDAYTADWATSLANLGTLLRNVGRFDEALAAAEKAEEIRRGLAEKQPDAYTADWAKSLGNLGTCLSKVGRFDEALAAAERAEEIWRGLAEKQPDAYTANWATSVGNLGNCLSEVGRFDEALAAAEKAEETRRGLAEKQPDAYTADWATSLGNLGTFLSEVGRFDDELAAARKAEEIRRGLAEKQPDAYTADWATSLSNLADAQLSAKEFKNALDTAKDAILQIRPFASRYPSVYRPWLGLAKRAAAESYFELDRLGEALAEAGRSVEIWTDVALLRHNYESVQIAKAFRALIKCQLALGQSEAAMETLGSAFDILHKPLNDNPKPLQMVMSEVVHLASAADPDSVARVVPAELLAIVTASS
jgi:tetratricopeptide (TPR) repeat protein